MSDGFHAFDLVPPVRFLAPGRARQRDAYVPRPLAEGMARVVLDEDFYTGPGFSIYVDGSRHWRNEVFDVPREQYERWEAVRTAYFAVQEEIGALLYPAPTNRDSSNHQVAP